MSGGVAFLAFALVIALAVGCRGRDREVPPEVTALVRETVEASARPAEATRKEPERRHAWAELERFYRKRAYQPAWLDGRGALPRATEMVAALDLASSEGIDLGRYNRPRLERLLGEARQLDLRDPARQRQAADLDVTFTYTFLTLATHLASGRLQPDTLRTGWYTQPRNVDLDGTLARALASGDKDALHQALAGLTPPGEDYARLRTALARYREIAAHGGWPAVPAGPDLRPGSKDPRVGVLRQRLAAEGDLAASPGGAAPASTSSGPVVFDRALAEAVGRFQRRHGLDATGVVDADTLAELDVPAAERVRQIALNMERWRWMPSDLGQRYILVNVPEYEMKLVEGGREALAMRVVVGKTQSQTPVFSDKMTYIELNPQWNLPDSIVRNEVAPKLAGNPGYLASHDMEVVRAGSGGDEVVDPSGVDYAALGRSGSPYRLRQRSGPDNPLGRIKFMFPNEFNVYLHDTPADHLFKREERDFSHGCVRLERPLDLAAYLLKDDPRWTPEAIQKALDEGSHETVTLPHPLPVHILYWTAWVEKDGTVQFRKDIYGHDAALAKALTKEPPITFDPEALRGEERAGEGVPAGG